MRALPYSAYQYIPGRLSIKVSDSRTLPCLSADPEDIQRTEGKTFLVYFGEIRGIGRLIGFWRTLKQDPEGFPDFLGSLPHQVFLELAGKWDVVDIAVTLVAEEKEPLLGVRTFRGPVAGFREYPVEFKAGGCKLLIAPLTPSLQECFDYPLPLPGGPENAHLMTGNRVRVKNFFLMDCLLDAGIPDSR